MYKNNILLVPDSSRTNCKKLQQYSLDRSEDTFKNDWNEACFCSFQLNLANVLDLMTLQD